MTKVLEANFERDKKKYRIVLMFIQLMDSRTFDYVLDIRHFDSLTQISQIWCCLPAKV